MGRTNCKKTANENIQSLMKQRDHALKRVLKNQVEHERHLFTTLVVKELRKAKTTFFIDAVREAMGNSK